MNKQATPFPIEKYGGYSTSDVSSSSIITASHKRVDSTEKGKFIAQRLLSFDNERGGGEED